MNKQFWLSSVRKTNKKLFFFIQARCIDQRTAPASGILEILTSKDSEQRSLLQGKAGPHPHTSGETPLIIRGPFLTLNIGSWPVKEIWSRGSWGTRCPWMMIPGRTEVESWLLLGLSHQSAPLYYSPISLGVDIIISSLVFLSNDS